MKKKIIIALIVLVVLGLAVWGIMYLKNKDKVSVLCYHNIATAEEKANFPEESDWVIDVENFEAQLKYLKDHNYKTLTMDEFYNWKQGKLQIPLKSVLITFDDGFLSNYHYAFPLLKKYGMNATVFVIGEYAANSTQTEWNSDIKTYMPIDLIDQAREEYPNIDFCSHSYFLHYQNALKENDIDDMHNDAVFFNMNIGETKYFAYPFGEYNHDLIEALKSMDYRLAFAYGPAKEDYRKASIKDDDFKIPRLNVSHGMEVWKFALRLWM